MGNDNSNNLKEVLIERIKNGDSSREVARSFDVAPSTIRKWAKDYGLKFKAEKKGFNKSTWGKM